MPHCTPGVLLFFSALRHRLDETILPLLAFDCIIDVVAIIHTLTGTGRVCVRVRLRLRLRLRACAYARMRVYACDACTRRTIIGLVLYD
jgi:hypothetical protein